MAGSARHTRGIRREVLAHWVCQIPTEWPRSSSDPKTTLEFLLGLGLGLCPSGLLNKSPSGHGKLELPFPRGRCLQKGRVSPGDLGCPGDLPVTPPGLYCPLPLRMTFMGSLHAHCYPLPSLVGCAVGSPSWSPAGGEGGAGIYFPSLPTLSSRAPVSHPEGMASLNPLSLLHLTILHLFRSLAIAVYVWGGVT